MISAISSAIRRLSPCHRRLQTSSRAFQLAGAEHFLVAQLPNTGRSFDLWPEQAAEATALTLSFNSLLASALDALVGIDFTLFDVFSLIEGIASIRAAFGLVEAITPCLEVPACAADPSRGSIANTFLLFHEIHATTATHALIGAAATAAVIPEPSTLMLGLGALGLLSYGWQHRKRA